MMVSNRCQAPVTGARVSVSILVFLDDGLEREIANSIPAVGLMFQSLFSWMMVSNHLVCHVSGPRDEFQSLFSWMMVSNQVDGLATMFRKRFQSLFSWMMVSNTICGFNFRIAIISFNPCFLG